MQLSRNSYTKHGTNLSDLIFILAYHYMVYKMALYLVLEKKETYFLLSVGKYFEVV